MCLDVCSLLENAGGGDQIESGNHEQDDLDHPIECEQRNGGDQCRARNAETPPHGRVRQSHTRCLVEVIEKRDVMCGE